MSGLIYGLVDPRTRLVRYVGLASKGLKRARVHRVPARLAARSHKNSWIKALLAAGLDYEVVVLEADPGDLQGAERFWIAYGRACGWPLTNMTDGGDGVLNPSADTRARRAQALRGRRLSPTHRSRIAAALRGRAKSREAVAKTAAALRGKKRSPESVRRQFASRAGYRHTPETIAKIRASNLGQKRPPSVGLAVAESNRRRARKAIR